MVNRSFEFDANGGWMMTEPEPQPTALAAEAKAHYATDEDFNWDTWWGDYIDPSERM